MFFLLEVVGVISGILIIFIILSPIGKGITASRQDRLMRKIDKYIDHFVTKGQYKYFRRKVRRKLKRSSNKNLELIVSRLKRSEHDIHLALADDEISDTQYLSDIGIEAKVKNKLNKKQDYEVYEALTIINLLQVQSCQHIILNNFQHYTGQAQFFILYSMVQNNDMDNYMYLVGNRPVKFDKALFKKLNAYIDIHLMRIGDIYE